MPDSIETEMRFSPNDIRILQALRAGPMNPDELSERMDGKYALAPLVNRGFIESTAMGWRITEAGRAACPNRRSTERLDVGIRPAAQDASAPEKRVSTIGIHDAARIVQQLGEFKPSFQVKKQEATMQEPDKNIKPRALQILEYIEAHPGCSNADIVLFTGISAAQPYIKHSIRNGDVIITANGKRKNTFSLADGATAAGIYFKHSKNTGGSVLADSFSKAKEIVNDFAQTMQEISQENAAGDEHPSGPTRITAEEWIADELEMQRAAAEKTMQAKVLKLDLPQRLDAEFCIKTLLTLMPHSHVIKIRKASDGSGIAEIDGRTLAEQIAPDIADIDVTLSALNTINQAMPS